MMKLEGRAPAKLNLTLEVLGRRADGYHEVASVMHTLSLCDTLTLWSCPRLNDLNPALGEFHIVEASDSPPLRDAIPTDSRNLVWQAVERFVALTPRFLPAPRGDARQQFWVLKRQPQRLRKLRFRRFMRGTNRPRFPLGEQGEHKG
jgi:4-diphosphocytidyl-2C-methyl-D-erythritol kinase